MINELETPIASHSKRIVEPPEGWGERDPLAMLRLKAKILREGLTPFGTSTSPDKIWEGEPTSIRIQRQPLAVEETVADNAAD